MSTKDKKRAPVWGDEATSPACKPSIAAFNPVQQVKITCWKTWAVGPCLAARTATQWGCVERAPSRAALPLSWEGSSVRLFTQRRSINNSIRGQHLQRSIVLLVNKITTNRKSSDGFISLRVSSFVALNALMFSTPVGCNYWICSWGKV